MSSHPALDKMSKKGKARATKKGVRVSMGEVWAVPNILCDLDESIFSSEDSIRYGNQSR